MSQDYLNDELNNNFDEREANVCPATPVNGVAPDKLCEELRAAYQALLNNVLISNKLLSQETEEDDILSLLLSITRLIIDFEAGAVFKLEGGSYRQVSAMDINSKFESIRDSYLSEGMYEWAASQKRTLVMPEGENNTRILVPMVTEKANVGILDLQIPLDADLIRNQDLDLLWVVVTNASSRCEQIKLNRWSGLVDILLSTLEKVNASEQIEMLFDSILKGLDRLLHCSKYLLLIDNNGELAVKARYDDGVSYCISKAYKDGGSCKFVEQALESKKTLRVPNINDAEQCIGCTNIGKRPYSETYLMIVPLVIDNNVYGVISIIDESYNSKLFTDDSQHIVELFANQVTIAIYQTQLRDELQSKNAKINKEIKMAGEVQQSLLPLTKKVYDLEDGVKIRVHIDDKNYTVTGFYSPCSTLGGDFYDVIEESNNLNITIADVSGHGLSSSLITALYKMALHKFVNVNNKLQTNEVCSLLNSDLCKFIKTGDYITAFIVFLDKITNTMTYSSAGHPYPLYYNFNENKIEMIEANGLPFAMLENQKYPIKSLKFNSGDKLLLYTDGITEAVSPEHGMFKKEKLVDLLEKHKKFNSYELMSNIYKDLVEYAKSSDFADDISMLLLEIK